MTDYAELKKLAEAATNLDGVDIFRARLREDAFRNAINPQTVLELLDELESLRDLRNQMIEHYSNQDMNHVDFRVHAYKHALTLKEHFDA